MLIRDFGVTTLIATPSYALYLGEVAADMGIDPRTLPLRIGMFGSEPWSEQMRAEIEERLNLRATDNYGLTEVMGPGVAGECAARNGLHLSEDHFYVEVINPETGEVLPEGCEENCDNDSHQRGLPGDPLPDKRYNRADAGTLCLRPDNGTHAPSDALMIC